MSNQQKVILGAIFIDDWRIEQRLVSTKQSAESGNAVY